MRVPAKYALRSPGVRVPHCSVGNLLRQAQPVGIEAVETAGNSPLPEIQLLHLQINPGKNFAERHVPQHKAVELMAMNRKVTQAAVLPGVLLVDFHAHQVRHHVAQAAVMISLDPDHFDFALRIGKLADVAEELPVLFLEPAKVQITEDIAQQDQPLKRDGSQRL